MINNPVGINVDHVMSKDNEIADKISRIKSDLVLLTKMKQFSRIIPLWHPVNVFTRVQS